jgi:hypothetical protein
MSGALLLILRQGLALGALALLAVLWGRGFLARLVPAATAQPWYEEAGFAVALGLGGFGTALFLVGLVGELTVPVIALAAVLGALLLSWRLPRMISAPSTAPLGRWVWVVPAALVVPAFALSLYPPTGFDETTYHLPLAAAFAHHHRLVLVPDALFPIAPSLCELLFASLLLVAGDVATHVVQLLCLLALSLAVFAAGERFGDRRAGILGVALWLANPLVTYQAATAYVDLAFSLFCFLAVMAWERWREAGDRRWLVAAGALAGFADGVKHIGLIWIALLAVATWIAAPRSRRWALSAAFLASAGVTSASWLLRSFWATGDPVFPLLATSFPGLFAGLAQALNAPLTGVGGNNHHYVSVMATIAAHPWSLLTLPWRAAFDRASIGLQAPLAPYWLVVLPLIAATAWWDRRLRRWLALALAYALLGGAGNIRFLLPAVALMAAAGGISGARWLAMRQLRARVSRPTVAILALTMALLGPAYGVYKIWRAGPLPTTPPEREAFLTRRLPGYAALADLNQRCGSRYTLYAFDAENLAYYAQGRFLGQRGGLYPQRPLQPLLTAPASLQAALVPWGVDHLLIVQHPGYDPLVRAPDADFGVWFHALRVLPEGVELFELLDPHGRSRASCRWVP